MDMEKENVNLSFHIRVDGRGKEREIVIKKRVK